MRSVTSLLQTSDSMCADRVCINPTSDFSLCFEKSSAIELLNVKSNLTLEITRSSSLHPRTRAPCLASTRHKDYSKMGSRRRELWRLIRESFVMFLVVALFGQIKVVVAHRKAFTQDVWRQGHGANVRKKTKDIPRASYSSRYFVWS